jgi:hypothetical protein
MTTISYATIHQTISQLTKMHRLLSKPENWRQGEGPDEKAARLDEAFHIVEMDVTAYQDNVDKDDVYPGDLKRGEIPEPVWFVRQAMNKVAPEFGGLIFKWNDAPSRTHEEVLGLITSAIDLAKNELAKMLASDDGVDMSGVVLHRWGDRHGETLCAMSALSQMLGYFPLTDNPIEVDPGLAALVNLLNDRSDDHSRQRLVSRLVHIPNTGRTKICSLIADVFFPQALEMNWFDVEASDFADCKTDREKAKAYTSIGERLLEPDGIGDFASGCFTLAAALKTKDPVARDILAVSAASQIIAFEADGENWFALLNILDCILGLEASHYADPQTIGDFDVSFGKGEPSQEAIEVPNLTIEEEKHPIEEVYDFGIRVRWFPALVAKFPDRLEKIAEKILDEVAEIGNTTIFMRRFPFGDEEVMIVTSWDDDLDMLFADADLVAYLDPVGEIDLDGDGEALPLLQPVPASDAGTIH